AQEDADPNVRAWSVQLVCEQPIPEQGWYLSLEEMALKDESAVVRLAIASGMQRVPLEKRWVIAAKLLSHADDSDDHNLPLMYWYAIEPLVMADTPRAMKLAAESKIPLISRYIVRRAAAEEPGYEALLAHLSAADEETQTWMLEEIVAALKLRAN